MAKKVVTIIPHWFRDNLMNSMKISPNRLNRKVSDDDKDVTVFRTLFSDYKNFLNQKYDDIDLIYNEFDEIDDNSSDAFNMLEIVSDESSMLNRDKKARIWFQSENKSLEKYLNEMINRLGLSVNAREYIRYIGKYGRYVVKPNIVGIYAPTNTISESVKSDKWNNITYNNSVKFLCYSDKEFFQDQKLLLEGDELKDIAKHELVKASVEWIDDQINSGLSEKEKYYRTIVPYYTHSGEWKGYRVFSKDMTDKNEKDFKYWDFVEFKIGRSAIGNSLLAPVRVIWRGLDLLEKSIELWRLSRSPQLLVASIPVSGSDPLEYINTVKMFKKLVEKYSTYRDGQKQESQARVPSPLETLYVPKFSENKSDVEVIHTTADVTSLADIEYKRNKYLSVLYRLIDAQSITGISDTSKLMTTMNIRLMGLVERLQSAYMSGVDRLAQIELALIDIPVTENLYTINMMVSNNIMESLKMDHLQMAAQVGAGLIEMADSLGIDKKEWSEFILKDFLSSYFGDMLSKYDEYNAKKTTDKMDNLPIKVESVEDPYIVSCKPNISSSHISLKPVINE